MDWDGILNGVIGFGIGVGLTAAVVGGLTYHWSSDYPIVKIKEVKEITFVGEDNLKSRYGVIQVSYPDGSSRIFTTNWEIVDCGKREDCKVSSPSLVDKLNQAMTSGENTAISVGGDRISSRWTMTPWIESVSDTPSKISKQ